MVAPEGEWTIPTTKSVLMGVVNMTNYRSFDKWANSHGLRKEGQLFSIRIDRMDQRTHAKFLELE